MGWGGSLVFDVDGGEGTGEGMGRLLKSEPSVVATYMYLFLDGTFVFGTERW
jgi:hypothetical protein